MAKHDTAARADQEVYERVHELRLERGLRHKDCATAIGLGTREAFRQRRSFRREELKALAKLFGLPARSAFPSVWPSRETTSRT